MKVGSGVLLLAVTLSNVPREALRRWWFVVA